MIVKYGQCLIINQVNYAPTEEGKLKKESRSMSQPSGLETPASDELKTKKGLAYYLKPWKWRKKTQIVTQNSTEEADGEPRRNSGKGF